MDAEPNAAADAAADADADDLALADGLVRAAGRLAAEMRAVGVTTSRKGSVSDVVTEADHAAEALIAGRLRERRPGDGLVGEEGSGARGQSGRTWYVDPVDGTYNYAAGLPVWCCAVALVDARGPVLGAVHHPAADETWLGGRGGRPTRNGVELPPLPDRGLAESSLVTYLHPSTLPDPARREPLLRALRPAATMRSFGSGSVELSWVAAGRLGGFLQSDCLPWDWYPGAALVLAAGGAAEVVEVDGHRWHVAGPRRLVDDVIAALLRR